MRTQSEKPIILYGLARLNPTRVIYRAAICNDRITVI